MTDEPDVLERARKHLQRMSERSLEWETKQIMAEMAKDLEWYRGRPPGKTSTHWLIAAFDRVAAGEREETVLLDFGYERTETSRGAI